MIDATKMIYEEKQKQIADLSKVVSKYQRNVEEVRFELYEKDPDGWREEFILVIYKGGAFTVLGVNGNSFLANFQAISEVLEHGRYNHDYYEKVKKDYRRIL